MTLDDMIQLAEEQARRVMIGTKEQLTPMWLMLNWDGKIEIAATPWGSSAEKHLVVEAMRNLMRERQVIAYSLLTEAWMARVQSEEIKKPYTGPPPSERADRRESVVAVAANRAGQSKHRHWETIRDKKGRCRELRRLGGPEDQISSYIFDNLLEDLGRPN
jgi:hypothetical protein